MKYLALLGALVIICFLIARQMPLGEVKDAVIATGSAPLAQGNRDPAPSTGTALKRPIDRAHAVLEQVKARNGDGEF